MATIGNLYMRRSLKDTGDLAWNPAAAQSPDILPWSVGQQTDLATFFAANYDTDPSRAILPGHQNFIYVRAKNIGESAATGNIFLYQAPSSMVLYPELWSGNPIKSSSGKTSVEVPSTQPDKVGVGREGFVWTPPVPTGREHYCFVSRVDTKETVTELKSVKTLDDLALLLVQGQLTSRNVLFVEATAPQVAVSTGYMQGEEAADLRFMATCRNCPIDGTAFIQFTSREKLPDGSRVNIAKTKITKQNFVVGTDAIIPADWKSDFDIDYWSKNPSNGPDWKIEFHAVKVVENPQHAVYKYGRTLAEWGWSDALYAGDGPVKSSAAQESAKLVLVGAATLVNSRIL